MNVSIQIGEETPLDITLPNGSVGTDVYSVGAVNKKLLFYNKKSYGYIDREGEHKQLDLATLLHEGDRVRIFLYNPYRSD